MAAETLEQIAARLAERLWFFWYRQRDSEAVEIIADALRAQRAAQHDELVTALNETTGRVDEERRRWYRALEYGGHEGLTNLEGLAPEVVGQKVSEVIRAQASGRAEAEARIAELEAERDLMYQNAERDGGGHHWPCGCRQHFGENHVYCEKHRAVAQGSAEGRIDYGPSLDCPRCHGTGEEPNAQFRCACRWNLPNIPQEKQELLKEIETQDAYSRGRAEGRAAWQQADRDLLIAIGKGLLALVDSDNLEAAIKATLPSPPAVEPEP